MFILSSMFRMRFLIIVLITTISCFSQKNEIGFHFGGNNYIGEIGNTQYINPNKIQYGLIYKRNINDRLGLRAQFTKGIFIGDDLKSSSEVRRNRGYFFSNSFNSLSIGIDISYVPFTIGEFGVSWTPFLFVGIERFVFDNIYFPRNENIGYTLGKDFSVGIPFGGGIKFNFEKNWIITADIQPRFVLSDNLDGSYPDLSKQPLAERFSTSLSSDWLVFVGISITYVFGKIPCCKD